MVHLTHETGYIDATPVIQQKDVFGYSFLSLIAAILISEGGGISGEKPQSTWKADIMASMCPADQLLIGTLSGGNHYEEPGFHPS
jgi:hypothetical protein